MVRVGLLLGLPAALLLVTASLSDVSSGQSSSGVREPGIRLLKNSGRYGNNLKVDQAEGPANPIEYLPLPSPEEARLLDLLHARATFLLEELTLDEFCHHLGVALEIDVFLDRRELEDFGIFAEEETISIDLKNVEVEQALRLILDPLELAHEVEGSTLRITSQEMAFELLFFRMYLVKDLMQQSGGTVDGNWLVRLIVNHIEVDAWDPVGAGTIALYPQAHGLAVDQTQEVHDRVLEMLRMLRKARRISGIAGSDRRFFPGREKRRPLLSLPAR